MIDANSMVMRSGMTHLPGIGRTTMHLVEAFQNLDDLPIDIILFTNTIRGKFSLSNPLFKRINIPVRTEKIKKLPLFDFIIPHKLLHIPHNYAEVSDPEKTVVTIHDAMFFSYPEEFLGHEYAREHYPALAKSAKAIITCSNSSKEDIVTYIGIPQEKVTVAYWGINRDVFYPVDKIEAFVTLESKGLVKRQYFIFVSCDIGRKNTVSVMHAYRKALKANINHDLILVWGNPPQEYLKEFFSEINSGRIKILPHVDDTQLRLLYAAATLTWFPSKYEGFGLPVLESMACGTPVVTCSNSSLKEVGGDAALYVEPDDIDVMTDIMISFDKGWNSYDDLVESSLKHAGTFTWEKTAKKYVDFYLANL